MSDTKLAIENDQEIFNQCFSNFDPSKHTTIEAVSGHQYDMVTLVFYSEEQTLTDMNCQCFRLNILHFLSRSMVAAWKYLILLSPSVHGKKRNEATNNKNRPMKAWVYLQFPALDTGTLST